MEKTKAKFCPAMWFSGFFGLGALVHLVRVITGFNLVIADHPISRVFSGGAVLIFGILSLGLLSISLKRPCENGKTEASSCCK